MKRQTLCWCALCSTIALHPGQGAQASATDASGFIEELVVVAHPLSGEGLAQPRSILEGRELDRALAGTLGETLLGQPGIHSATFGQAVGRPVIHGMSGPRVKVMEDRINSMDVSVSSPDHATTIEPFLADRIEVLKGPSTLLYGNGAIGGVVDVHTGRIPHVAGDDLIARAELRGADNASLRTAAGMVQGSLGSFVLHLDGFYRDADAYEIPGYAESEALREQEQDEGGGAHGVLPASELETRGGAVGFSFVGDRGFIGAALSSYDALYGLPGGHDHEDSTSAGHARLDMEQTRLDFEAGVRRPFPGSESLNLRIGSNEYQHVEIEPDGAIGTRFSNQALEGRFEVMHTPVAGISGAAGLQLGSRDYEATGEEAYVPPVNSHSVGVFYVGERSFSSLDVEAGARYERVSHDPEVGPARGFDLGAASIGLIAPLDSGLTLSALADYSMRAPTTEELYSDGPHLATSSFEIGDPNLGREKATNLSASIQYDNDDWLLAASVYYTDFADFIYQEASGDESEALRVLRWQQGGATFRGLDLEAEWRLLRWDDGLLTLRGVYDQVRAELKHGEHRNLPRIPPRRWGLGLMLDWHRLTGSLDYARSSDQQDVAEFELPTEGFEDLRAYLGYTFEWGRSTLELFVAGRNLTDAEQRHSTSFIKDFAPQPGRTLEGGVRIAL